MLNRAMLVPTMLKRLMDYPDFRRFDLSSLNVITYGAAPMPLPVIRQAIAEFPGVRFINAFGQTETASTITMLPPEDHELDGTPQEVETKLRRLTSIGKPLEDVEVMIVDEEGNPGNHRGSGGNCCPRFTNDERVLAAGSSHRRDPPLRLGLHRRPGLSGRGQPIFIWPEEPRISSNAAAK